MDDDQQLQRQAQALGEPSRFAIYEHIARSSNPVGVAELTELMGFNHNAVRQHLAKLVDADLVAESTEKRTTPGRPRLAYQARSDAFDLFQNRPGGSYQRLAAMLLELATSTDSPYEVGRRAALADRPSRPNELDPNALRSDANDIVGALALRLALDGFSPSVAGETITLGRCPFADLAAVEAGVICELHRGLIDGDLERSGGTTHVALRPKPPHTAGCIVELANN